jgi:hypothetical protein
MHPEPADFERLPYPLLFPSDWACLWDLGYLVAEARRRSVMSDPADMSDD